MNAAHFHLLLNHFPIIGSIIGLIILLYGIFMGSNSIRKTGLSLLFFASLFAIPTFLTGEGAEELVEDQAGISHDIIERHEEIAETLIWLIAFMGVAAAVTLIMEIKRQAAASIANWITVLLTAITIYFAVQVGTTGGSINHPEIQQELPAPEPASEGSEGEEEH